MKLKIKVKPNSKEQEITKVNENEYEVKLKERAENNKANIELIKILKKHFKKDVRIVSGLKSKKKVVEVR